MKSKLTRLTTKQISITMIALLFCGKIMYAQHITPFVINSTGATQTVASGILNFNVGEVAVSKISNGSYTITQGFLQPQQIFTTAISNKIQTNNSNWQVYPNPTSNNLMLVPINCKDAVWAKIFDGNGKEVMYLEVINNVITLDNLNAGSYLLEIVSSKQEILFTKQITKIN